MGTRDCGRGSPMPELLLMLMRMLHSESRRHRRSLLQLMAVVPVDVAVRDKSVLVRLLVRHPVHPLLLHPCPCCDLRTGTH